jgi:hypothetical protein
MDILQAVNDPKLFAPWFDGDSWRAWETVLAASFGLPLTAEQETTFKALAGGRTAPSQRVRELWCVAGRRSGKSLTGALIGVYLAAFADHKKYLQRGENAVVLLLATDKAQAGVMMNYVRSFVMDTPLISRMVKKESANEITLNNGATISVHQNSFRSVRGRTLAAAILDETAFWRSAESALPDRETYNALLPALATTGGMLVGLSSPYRRSGLLFDKWQKFFGKDGDTLVIHAPARSLNPSLDQSLIDAALENDPQAAASEWMAEWRSDLQSLLDESWIDDSVDYDRPAELPPSADKDCRAFCDPSGGRSDEMVLGIAHRENDTAVLDCLRSRKPPFDTKQVVQEFSAVLKSYGCTRVQGDRYSASWVSDAFRECGIAYEPSPRSKSEIYLESVGQFSQGKVRIPNEAALIAQLRGLERQGRDSVDHAPGAHDDRANGACGALLLCAAPVMTIGFAETIGRLVSSYDRDTQILLDQINPPPWRY